MNQVVTARDLVKSYGAKRALDGTSFDIKEGSIVGLIGPNGAGKTTALKALLGLTPFKGDLSVLGLDPFRQRPQLMRDVCFIADTAVLPRWIKVKQLLEFADKTHPQFDRDKCEMFLTRTDIGANARVGTLSKGMVVQLHLSIVMSIDARFLVLDEPTLGLDIMFRKEFYRTLIEDYFDEKKTILVTTHQVEEVENLLTDVLFINRGKIVLSETMGSLSDRFVMVSAPRENAETLERMGPVHQSSSFGRGLFLFSGRTRAELAPYGDVSAPSVADVFVATIQQEEATP